MTIIPGGPAYYAILFLIVGNIFAVVVGILMMTAPHRFRSWFSGSNRRISLRKLTKPLDISHETDRVLLKHPQWLGAAMLASSALILIRGTIFISDVSAVEGGRLLARLYMATKLPSGAWETLWLSLISLIMLGASLALVVGLLLMFDVKILKRWSKTANRWISLRRVTKPADKPNYSLDNLVRETPRVWGGVITLLALYVTVMLIGVMHTVGQ
jgi:hypothetical protein